jgi:hypothetical protein
VCARTVASALAVPRVSFRVPPLSYQLLAASVLDSLRAIDVAFLSTCDAIRHHTLMVALH